MAGVSDDLGVDKKPADEPTDEDEEAKRKKELEFLKSSDALKSAGQGGIIGDLVKGLGGK